MEKLDVIVLGGTGFSGKYIVKMCAKYNVDLTWGIAGRSEDKLKTLLTEIYNFDEEIKSIPVFHCDVKNKESMKQVCKRARLIINCVGPYLELGDLVVEACIETGCHYIDITVEPAFIINLSKKYHKMAEDANVLVIPACGLVAVPAVIGFMYLEQQFSGTLKSVECYSTLDLPNEVLYPSNKHCVAKSTTLSTIITRISHLEATKQLKEETYPKIEGLENITRSLHYRNGKIWFPNLFPDEDVAMMTQKYLLENEGRRPIPFKMYTTCTFSMFYLLFLPFLFVFALLLKMEWFRKLADKYPGFFTWGYLSNDGPAADVSSKLKCVMVLTGRGWDGDVPDHSQPTNKTLALKVTTYDAYQSTADAALASALTILKEYSKMPRGGVVNLGAAFRRTDIIKRLHEYGMTFEILET